MGLPELLRALRPGASAARREQGVFGMDIARLNLGAPGASDVLLATLQRRPELLAMRSQGSNVSLWHRAAEAGQVNLLRECVALVMQHAPLVRAAVLKRYALGIGAPNLEDDRVLLCKLLNGSDSQGLTALHLAASAGRAEVVEFLLQQGADAWRTDFLGYRTPLHCAAIVGHGNCAAALAHHMRNKKRKGTRYIDYCSLSGMTALHYAAGLGNINAVRALLQHGASIVVTRCSEYTDPYVPRAYRLSTPLHLAASGGHLDCATDIMMRYALTSRASRGRDPRHAHNCMHAKPHHVAKATNHHRVARFLDPSRSLSELFTLQQLQSDGDAVLPPRLGAAAASAAVPTLRAIAAVVLQSKLLRDLDAMVVLERSACGTAVTVTAAAPPAAEATQRAQPPTASPGPGSRSIDGSAHSRGSCHSRAGSRGNEGSLHSRGSLRSRGSADGMCDVCFDRRPDVALDGCSHRTCAACARSMARAMRAAPLQCPFCRTPVGGFARASNPSVGATSSYLASIPASVPA